MERTKELLPSFDGRGIGCGCHGEITEHQLFGIELGAGKRFFSGREQVFGRRGQRPPAVFGQFEASAFQNQPRQRPHETRRGGRGFPRNERVDDPAALVLPGDRLAHDRFA